MHSEPSRLNLVVFCGAGVSIHAGIPGMATFCDRLRDSHFLEASAQAEFDRIQDECNKMASLIGGSARNLEYLASFLSMLDLSRPEFRFPDCKTYASPRQALRLVEKCICGLTSRSIKSGDLAAMRSLLAMSTKMNVSIVTTNYDMHVEYAARQDKIALTPTPQILAAAASQNPNCMDRKNGAYRADCDKCVKLYKLHGSVNYFKSEQKVLFVEDRIDEVCDTNLNAESYRIRHVEGEPELREPLIVPPSVLKAGSFPEVEEQWRGAAHAISQADHLWFIGYSFPESDSYMRYFLAASLCNNPKLRQIVVVDKDRSVCNDRGKRLLKSPVHSEIYLPAVAEFAGLSIEPLLAGIVQTMSSSNNYVRDEQIKKDLHEYLRRQLEGR